MSVPYGTPQQGPQRSAPEQVSGGPDLFVILIAVAGGAGLIGYLLGFVDDNIAATLSDMTGLSLIVAAGLAGMRALPKAPNTIYAAVPLALYATLSLLQIMVSQQSGGLVVVLFLLTIIQFAALVGILLLDAGVIVPSGAKTSGSGQFAHPHSPRPPQQPGQPHQQPHQPRPNPQQQHGQPQQAPQQAPPQPGQQPQPNFGPAQPGSPHSSGPFPHAGPQYQPPQAGGWVPAQPPQQPGGWSPQSAGSPQVRPGESGAPAQGAQSAGDTASSGSSASSGLSEGTESERDGGESHNASTGYSSGGPQGTQQMPHPGTPPGGS